MASAEQIKALLKSHLTGDDSHFYSVAMQVAAHEAKLGHGKLALELRDLIDAAKLKGSRTESNAKPIPLNKPQGELARQLMSAYPKLTPETIRALIVHSAKWTESMLKKYLPANKAPTKNDFVNLIRHCGWGVPNLESAKWSASNSLTLVVEDKVHPYKKVKSDIKTRDMNLHKLPWPK